MVCSKHRSIRSSRLQSSSGFPAARASAMPWYSRCALRDCVCQEEPWYDTLGPMMEHMHQICRRKWLLDPGDHTQNARGRLLDAMRHIKKVMHAAEDVMLKETGKKGKLILRHAAGDDDDEYIRSELWLKMNPKTRVMSELRHFCRDKLLQGANMHKQMARSSMRLAMRHLKADMKEADTNKEKQVLKAKATKKEKQVMKAKKHRSGGNVTIKHLGTPKAKQRPTGARTMKKTTG